MRLLRPALLLGPPAALPTTVLLPSATVDARRESLLGQKKASSGVLIVPREQGLPLRYSSLQQATGGGPGPPTRKGQIVSPLGAGCAVASWSSSLRAPSSSPPELLRAVTAALEEEAKALSETKRENSRERFREDSEIPPIGESPKKLAKQQRSGWLGGDGAVSRAVLFWGGGRGEKTPQLLRVIIM